MLFGVTIKLKFLHLRSARLYFRAKAPYVPHAKNPTSGAIDICFLSDLSIQEWIKRFGSHNIPIENGPVQKTGATGPLMSIYVRDPDGSLIEISNQI
jgi:catechol 2,3-dioxygenase-like lactoylglutathione lyase family enzyme